jgi:uncharacterized membrane protein YfcA
MNPEILYPLAAGIFCIAVLYSAVGHAGASGYIAVMSLLSVAPEVIKPTALALNILVACIATWQFAKAGHFIWRLFLPFALPAVPFAFLGGYVSLPAAVFKIVLGVVLLYSAARFVSPPQAEQEPSAPPLLLALACGSGIGLMAGLTGTGGGIFLTPLLLTMGWARTKSAAAVSAFFILVNSISGLLGNLSSTANLPPNLLLLLSIVACGGLLGSNIGSGRLTAQNIRRLLSVVLLIAGLKLIMA